LPSFSVRGSIETAGPADRAGEAPMTDTVLSTCRDGVRTITLNRPGALNAMNAALVDELAAAMRAANADPATRVVVLTGSGRAFCAGADLKERRGGGSEREIRAGAEGLQQVTREIVFGDTLVIGAINGYAVGGGFEWALNCDLPIWAENAVGFFPEVSWGLFVTGGVSAILPNLVGMIRAKEMILLGGRYTAAELKEAGVAWRVVPDDRLMDEAQDVAARIAALPERAVRDVKRTLTKASLAGLHGALELEVEAVVRSHQDPETAVRTAAFSKRP